MIGLLKSGRFEEIQATEVNLESSNNYLGFCNFSELMNIQMTFKIDPEIFKQGQQSRYAKFESGEGWDFVCLNVLDFQDITMPVKRVCIYLSATLMLVAADDLQAFFNIINRFKADINKSLSATKLFYYFLDQMTEKDSLYLDQIEEEISELEDDVVSVNSRNVVREISLLRKKLMIMKHYYEQLYDILDEIQENENQLIDMDFMRYFKIFGNRIDRLYHSVLNLRDYVTQVREAYQTEVDINLNNIMKLSTVITTIFFPMTLITSWYGMNLIMPEFHWTNGYLFVIGLSLLVLLTCVLYFKRHKWF